MSTKLKELNLERRGKYFKDPEVENLVLEINRALLPMEQSAYRDVSIDQPIIFVFGLPRSGTTLVTQIIAQCVHAGFINNFVARFWQVPLTGIRLARAVGIPDRGQDFESMFGATDSLHGIHEFGYFWRHWLKKETFEDVERARELESQIDWTGLCQVLANIQHEFGRPMVMKNLLGSYHLGALKAQLGKVIYVYIERDELDVAESILKARRQYYSDPNKWWSYVPPDYRKVFDLDYWHQIAGQVVLLNEFFQRELERAEIADNVIRVRYHDLVRNPDEFIASLSGKSESLFGQPLEMLNEPPELELRSGNGPSDERDKLRRLIEEFRSNDGFGKQ